VSHAIDLRRLLVKALTLLMVRDGARINAADLRLRCRQGDHRWRAITATSPEFNAHRRHHCW